jgi:probable rRNA maturation factor
MVISKDPNLEILNKTKGKLPRLPFASIKEKVLGKSYELSITFVGKAISQKLNREHRDKDYPTNILSFALSKNSGELVINPDTVKKGAPDFDMDYQNFLAYLLIHGMLHLKGMQHGSTMDSKEAYYLRVLNFKTRGKR